MPRSRVTTAKNLPPSFEELVRHFPPYTIRDEIAYENAQQVIDLLTSLPSPTQGQLQYLDTLTTLFEAYENERHAIDPSSVSPLDCLRLLMEEHGMTASDLGRLLGERSLGPKILNGQRGLSKAHIRKLAEHFHVSPAVFLE